MEHLVRATVIWGKGASDCVGLLELREQKRKCDRRSKQASRVVLKAYFLQWPPSGIHLAPAWEFQSLATKLRLCTQGAKQEALGNIKVKPHSVHSLTWVPPPFCQIS